MKKRAKETDEEARRRLRLIAIRYRLGIECIDFLSNEEVREALHQFEIGLLPVGFPTIQRARPKRGSGLSIQPPCYDNPGCGKGERDQHPVLASRNAQDRKVPKKPVAHRSPRETRAYKRALT
jgi:hypothetical protein